jgi:hypothetical protein
MPRLMLRLRRPAGSGALAALLSSGNASGHTGSVTTSTSDLGAATVLDPEGRAHPLESLWSHRPVVIGFVRHFG